MMEGVTAGHIGGVGRPYPSSCHNSMASICLSQQSIAGILAARHFVSLKHTLLGPTTIRAMQSVDCVLIAFKEFAPPQPSPTLFAYLWISLRLFRRLVRSNFHGH